MVKLLVGVEQQEDRIAVLLVQTGTEQAGLVKLESSQSGWMAPLRAVGQVWLLIVMRWLFTAVENDRRAGKFS